MTPVAHVLTGNETVCYMNVNTTLTYSDASGKRGLESGGADRVTDQ